MKQQNGKIRVALIYGGTSGEHPISCATAGAVMAALDPEKYEVLSIAITERGDWVPGVTDPRLLQLNKASTHVAQSETRIVFAPGSGRQSLLRITGQGAQMRVTDLGPVDVAFPLLHGPFGEDGTIQGLFEMANVPYVGCGVFASAAGMDKEYMKTVLCAAGIPTGPYTAVTAKDWLLNREDVLEKIRRLKFPLYVKPARAGSSLGITRVETSEGLVRAIETAQEYDPKVIVEQGISGMEVECAVLGGGLHSPARASVPGRAVMGDAEADGFYDFRHKYIATDSLQMQIPAQIPSETAQKIRRMAVRAFDAVGCEGLTRVDFFVTEDGSVLVNEINTMPGFTPFSMYPTMWEKTGISYPQLIDRLIELALERGTGLH